MAKLSKGITFLGWLTILSSVFGLIAFLISTYALPNFTTGLSTLSEEASKLNKELVAHNQAWMPFLVPAGCLHLWVGIALLKGRGWARAFICYQTAIGILLAPLVFLAHFAHQGFRLSVLIMPLLMLAWSAFVLYYLNRSAIKIQFTPVSSRIRLTILSLTLVFGAVGFIQARRQTLLIGQLNDVLEAHRAQLEQSSGPRMTLGRALNTRKAMKLLSESSELSKQGKLSEATATTSRAIDATQKAFGGDSFMTAAMLHPRAENYKAQGQLDQAIAELERSVAIWEKQKETGDAQLDYQVIGGTAGTMQQLAELYEQRGRNTEAIALLKKALPLWERVANWPDMAKPNDRRFVEQIHNRLAALYAMEGKTAEAQAEIEKRQAETRMLNAETEGSKQPTSVQTPQVVSTRFCPVGGEVYPAAVKICPKHGVELRDR